MILEKTVELAEKLIDYGANHFVAYPLIPISGSESWQMAIKESQIFRESCENQDALDIAQMVDIWIDTFCDVGLEDIMEKCDIINGFCANFRNPTEQWAS